MVESDLKDGNNGKMVCLFHGMLQTSLMIVKLFLDLHLLSRWAKCRKFFVDKNDNKIALVIDFNDIKENAFLTSDLDEFQVGFKYHPNEKIIEKHVHNEIKRVLSLLQNLYLLLMERLKLKFLMKMVYQLV